MLLRRYHKTGAVKAAPEVVEKPEEKLDDSFFTRNDIETMKYMKLKSVAKKHGIETEDREAKDIREDLIEKLGL